MPKHSEVINEKEEFLKYLKSVNSDENKNKNENNFQYENKLYKLFYGKSKSNFAEEKRIVLNEFFADIFAAKNIKWNIRNGLNQSNKEVKDIFEKYLKKCDFELKIWDVKYMAGCKGRYCLVMFKSKSDKVDNNDLSITEPRLTPAAVNFKNTLNDEIVEISVNYENHLLYGKSMYCLNETYSIFNNRVSISRNLWDVAKTKLVKRTKRVLDINTYRNLKYEKVDVITQHFLPLEVLKFNLQERPRTYKVDSKLDILEKYNENLAILPFWEKGGIIANVANINSANQETENCKFMKYLLFNGFVEANPIEKDYPKNLTEQIVTWQPNSVMQSMKKTSDEIWNEIKEDEGMPSMDKINSAQKTIPEIYAKQFLTSPKLDREKMLYLNFLGKFGKKFLMFLNECNLEESKSICKYDFSQWNVTAEIDLLTEENIFAVLKTMGGKNNDEQQ